VLVNTLELLAHSCLLADIAPPMTAYVK
jgi:hypothetical protein